MKYEKLVRDLIPAIIKRDGRVPITRLLEGEEYERALTQKLHEEVGEFLENPCVEEVADILEVLHTICAVKGIDLATLEETRQKKVSERGGFKLGFYLESVE